MDGTPVDEAQAFDEAQKLFFQIPNTMLKYAGLIETNEEWTNSNTISSSFSLLHVVASVRSVFVVALIEILIVWSVAIEIAILTLFF